MSNDREIKIQKKRFTAVEILRLSKAATFCILKNIVLSVIDFGRELCFYFFHFFIFYANLEFRPTSCQFRNRKFFIWSTFLLIELLLILL